MFSKSKISDSTPTSTPGGAAASDAKAADAGAAKSAPAGATAPGKPKPSPSLLATDLKIKGNVVSSGDIQIEGTIEGDVRAHLLKVGENATVRGEVVADDVVVDGRVVGRVRGLKVRLTASAKVEGDIVHKTIAIESGAHFEGSVQRQEDPLSNAGKTTQPLPKKPAGDTGAA